MKRTAARRVLVVTVLGAATAAAAWYVFRQPDTEPGHFGGGTAMLVAGYVAFPMLALLATGLLLIAILLLTAAAVERRRPDREDPFPREEH